MKKIALMLGLVLGTSTLTQCINVNPQPHQCEHLWQACEENHVACLNNLLADDANPNSLDEGVDGLYPIHFANTVESLSALFDAGASINQQNTVTGNTPVHMAAQDGNLQLTVLLLALGCNLNIQNNSGQTPLDIAATDAIKNVITMHMQNPGALLQLMNNAAGNNNDDMDVEL